MVVKEPAGRRRYGMAGEALGRAGSGAALLVKRPSYCANFCGRP
jgi:hypothetical protein